ncbi:imidazole glycerol phosphate synthase subunit HisH [Campylobacter concisus]|uniref:imidazole glycerol phosphate synthase subunit HisH n=1 Tax=Campylobacter concisus TaxID=199 RepID=UPI000D2F7526|nr:imidazole glycerol phosphate synthase subunit HisH [Campylobacter concisus]
MIAIIDYGAGNIKSVINAFDFLDKKCTLVSKPENLKEYSHIVLPGVGAFGEAITKLKNNGMDEAVKEAVKSGKAFIGICLGMQLLFEKSFEFGEHEGLSLLPGKVVKFNEANFDKPLKIPHIGWNALEFKQNSPLILGLKKLEYLYFVHSYHVVCDDKFALAKTTYGYEFTSAVWHENIFGFQPHPEKSHEAGLKILENFARL